LNVKFNVKSRGERQRQAKATDVDRVFAFFGKFVVSRFFFFSQSVQK
jgi:hypothetical protein